MGTSSSDLNLQHFSRRFRCHLHISKKITYNLKKFNMIFLQKANIKKKLNSLVLSKDIFSFAEKKYDNLNILMDKKQKVL